MTATVRESASPGVYGTDEEKAARRAAYRAAVARMPQGALRHVASLYGRTKYQITMPPELLATFTVDELVDIADGGPGHFGGFVDRDAAAGVADVTVWID